MTKPKPKKTNVKPNRLIANVRYFDYSEYHRLLSSIDNIEHKLIIKLGYESLCRVTEITNLKARHLDFKESQIYIEPSLTKTGVGGWIEISEELANEIKAWLISEKRIKGRTEELILPDEYLFQPRQSRIINGFPLKKYTRHRLRQIFNKYVEKGGFLKIEEDISKSKGLRGIDKDGYPLRQYTFHSLRHSGIMHMIHDLRLPLDIVRAKSRHMTLGGLSHYARPSNKLVRDEIREARKKFEEQRNHM
jgi:integrase